MNKETERQLAALREICGNLAFWRVEMEKGMQTMIANVMDADKFAVASDQFRLAQHRFRLELGKAEQP